MANAGPGHQRLTVLFDLRTLPASGRHGAIQLVICIRWRVLLFAIERLQWCRSLRTRPVAFTMLKFRRCAQHVVFGSLLEGQELLNMIESEAGSDEGEPRVPVIIEDCGELVDEKAGEPYFGESSSDEEPEDAASVPA